MKEIESLKGAHGGGWRAMDTAPKDGTHVELLLYHVNRQYASERDRHIWEQVVESHWIDFNGGGWTWRGMAGIAQGWRPPAAAEAARK